MFKTLKLAKPQADVPRLSLFPDLSENVVDPLHDPKGMLGSLVLWVGLLRWVIIIVYSI